MNCVGKIAMLGCILIWPIGVQADSIWVGESAKNPIMAGDVQIVRVEANNLIYNIGGAETSKPLDQVQQINAEGETDFNAAEQAYRDGKLNAAAEGYQRAIRSTAKDWLRDRASVRLAELAAKSGRFDAASTAYVGLLLNNPALAGRNKPVLSDAAVPYYDSAIADVQRVLTQANLTNSQRSDLLSFLLEIYRAKQDTAGVNQTVGELIKLGTASPADVAMVKLASARSALQGRDYAKATAEIEQNRALFNDPDQQADAFFILAQAKDGIDGQTEESEKLKDIAIAYMRAVAAGKGEASRPMVSQSLLRVAQIEEKLRDPAMASQLYREISRDYAGQPAAGQAKTALERLK